MDHVFTKNLIKGRIAETVFEEMFRQTDDFIVIPLGYEHTTPLLTRYMQHSQIRNVLQNLRNAPDFALISQDRKHAFLVEVKFQHALDQQLIQHYAKQIHQSWKPCFMFVATPDGFYMDDCGDIAKSGYIARLSRKWSNYTLQHDYLHLMKEFV